MRKFSRLECDCIKFENYSLLFVILKKERSLLLNFTLFYIGYFVHMRVDHIGYLLFSAIPKCYRCSIVFDFNCNE